VCSVYGGGVIISPAQESAPRVIEVPAKGKEVPAQPKQEQASAPQKSRVTVVVPVDARLWVDNVECPLTSTVRSFETPALATGQQYVYNLKIEYMRDGQPVVQNQRAIITPGRPVQVDFMAGSLATASRE